MGGEEEDDWAAITTIEVDIDIGAGAGVGVGVGRISVPFDLRNSKLLQVYAAETQPLAYCTTLENDANELGVKVQTANYHHIKMTQTLTV